MKTFLLATLLWTWIPPLGLQAAEPAKQGQAEIIASIPARSSLEKTIRDRDRFNSRPAFIPGDGKPLVLTWSSREEAEAILKKALDAFNQLRTTLKAGTSVFDYPGILALGKLTFSGAHGSYQLELGLPPRFEWNHEVITHPDAFQITFDSKGMITQIEPIIAKQ